MYGLPKEVDLTFLKARELIQICIGAFQVQFHFDDNVHIYVTNAFEYVDPAAAVFTIQNAPSSAVLAEKLIGKMTGEVKPARDGTLEIMFISGDKIIFYDSDRAYECYEIRHGDKIIVV